jgi:hypothetical protein
MRGIIDEKNVFALGTLHSFGIQSIFFGEINMSMEDNMYWCMDAIVQFDNPDRRTFVVPSFSA